MCHPVIPWSKSKGSFLKIKVNKTENEFQSMTASQGNQSFFFFKCYYHILQSFLKRFDTILLFQQILPIELLYNVMKYIEYEVLKS